MKSKQGVYILDPNSFISLQESQKLKVSKKLEVEHGLSFMTIYS